MSQAETIGAILAQVVAVLERHRVQDFAFTGGIAVGVWSAPRQTKDLDVCGSLPADEVNRLLALRDGVRARSGQLPDMVRFRVGSWDVDLFVAKGDYDRACLARALHAQIEGVDVRVVTAEDLLIHKLIKLRSDRRRFLQDLTDIRAVAEAQREGLDWGYLKTWLEPADESLLRSLLDSTDEEIVRRLLGP